MQSSKIGKREFERKIAENIRKDSKSFYAHARFKSRVKNSVGPLTDDNGSPASTDKEMGELLNDFFAPVFTKELETCANAQRDGCTAEHRWALCSTPQSLVDAHYFTAVQ